MACSPKPASISWKYLDRPPLASPRRGCRRHRHTGDRDSEREILRAGRFQPLPGQAGNTRETHAQARDGGTLPALEREHLLKIVDGPGEQQPIGHHRGDRGIGPFAHAISIWMSRRLGQGYGEKPAPPPLASRPASTQAAREGLGENVDQIPNSLSRGSKYSWW